MPPAPETRAETALLLRRVAVTYDRVGKRTI
jgi:hypothetical protein